MYSLETIKKLGPNCFDAINNGLNKDEFYQSGPIEKTTEYTEVVTITFNPGFFCWFESFADFMVSGDDHLQIFYLDYTGFGPSVVLGETMCELETRDFLYVGARGQLFEANAFGGSCGYVSLIGVEQSHPGTGNAVIARMFEAEAATSLHLLFTTLIASVIYIV